MPNAHSIHFVLCGDSHQQLLHQVHHITDIVAVALDEGIAEVMAGAQGAADEDPSLPLKSTPRAGMQVVAKLHAVTMDLEARLQNMQLSDRGDAGDTRTKVHMNTTQRSLPKPKNAQ